MMNFDSPQAQNEFKEVFDKDISDLSARQVYWLIKFSKHVRGRCRSNKALANYLQRIFPGHIFKEVTKQGTRGSYTTLSVSAKFDPDVFAEDENSDE